jgi:hypothetical protein
MARKPVDVREKLLKIKNFDFANAVEQEYRPNINRTFNAIRDGAVSEDDLDALQNWCMTMLVVMAEMTPLQYSGARQRSFQLSAVAGHPIQDDLPVPYPGENVIPGTTATQTRPVH